jgi:hypothetical protein
MGLLDDAIREHLDLKRRRGADPSDVERAEREALGPVRRGPEEAEPSEPQLDQALPYDEEQGSVYADEQPGYNDPRGLPYDDEEEGDWGEAFDEEGEQGARRGFHEPFAEDDEPGFRPDRDRHEPPAANSGHVDEQPTQHMPLEPAETADDDPFDDMRGAANPAPHPAPPPAEDRPRSRGGQPAGGETVEYDVEPARAAEKGKSDDDVLEETPEFLQDTPDHDRLWFEQRPPRDFDFDG